MYRRRSYDNACRVFLVVVLSSLLQQNPALYASDAWFGDSAATSAGGSTQVKKVSKSSSWLPWPSSKPKSSARSQKPSTLGNMTRSTKKAWNSTVSFLNPFDNKPAAKKPPKSTSTGWFGGSKPPESPPTVSDWIGGDRPQF